MRLQAVVRTPAVQNMSFTAIGMPSSARAAPAASRASAAFAMARAASGVSSTKALRLRARSIAERCASVSSAALNSLPASPARASAMVSVVRSVMAALERDESSSRSSLLLEHDLFRKPVPTFRDHVLIDEQPGHRPAADVVDARVDDALALDLDQDRGLELGAVEFAQGEREIGALGVVGGDELGTELDLRGPVRAAHRDAPAPVRSGEFEPLGELGAQLLGRLLEREAPVIKHVMVVGGAHAAGEIVEVRVLIGMQPHHLDR